MTYARNWTRTGGTNSSYGASLFQAPQRKPESPTRRYGRYARELGRQAVNVAIRNRYRLATNLAGKIGRYYFENQLDYVSRTSWGDAFRFLNEDMPWAKQGQDGPMVWKYPSGYACVSTRSPSASYDTCGEGVNLQNNTGTNQSGCSTWHYNAQAITTTSSGNRVFMGPRLGGVYGCARMNFDTIVFYPRGTAIRKTDVYRAPETRASVMPLPATLPQTPRQGLTRQPMPMIYPEPMPEAMPLPRYRRGRLRLRPYQLRARQFSPQPLRSGGRGSGITTVAHNLLPPNKRDDEAKFKINLGLAGKLYGGFTEFQDFTESVAKAVKLPNDRDCRSRNPYKAWACIIANRDKLDRNEAAYNIIENQIEDFLIGQFGRAGAKAVAKAAAAGYYRSPVGLQFGGAYHRETLSIGEIERIK